MLSDKIIVKFPEAPEAEVKVFSSDTVSLIETSYVPFDEFTYDEYHFIIPLRNAPPIKIGNAVHPLNTGSIICCNPGQSHRAAEGEYSTCLFYSLDISKEFFRSIAYFLFKSEKLEFDNRLFVLNPEIRRLIESFKDEFNYNQPGRDLFLQTLGTQISISILREGFHNLTDKLVTVKDYCDWKCVNTAIEFLKYNLNKDVSLDDLAHITSYSSFHFLRIFKKAIGVTPFEYLMEIRINNAMKLIKHSRYSITEICYLCGFKNISHFDQAFKKRFGVSPSNYRKNL